MSRLGVALLSLALVVGLAVALRLAVPGEPAPTGETTSSATNSQAGEIPDGAERARVVSHVDGDTLHVVSADAAALQPGEDTTVRLLEIDTPEHGRSGAAAECYAEESSAALRDLLPVGADAWVLPDRDLLDPYGRTLLYVWTADGAFVNLELVRQGYARAVLFEPNDLYIDRMRGAEERARDEERGLWGACARSSGAG